MPQCSWSVGWKTCFLIGCCLSFWWRVFIDDISQTFLGGSLVVVPNFRGWETTTHVLLCSRPADPWKLCYKPCGSRAPLNLKTCSSFSRTVGSMGNFAPWFLSMARKNNSRFCWFLFNNWNIQSSNWYIMVFLIVYSISNWYGSLLECGSKLMPN